MRHPLIRRPPRQEYCTAIAMKLFNIAHSRIDHHGRSAVNISSRANGAFGEHRRQIPRGISTVSRYCVGHRTDALLAIGIRLEARGALQVALRVGNIDVRAACMGWTDSPTIDRPRLAFLLSQQPLEPGAASRTLMSQ
jgi:hypothetical protein